VLLDAANVDVYKGAHCVVFMYDPRKKWTFDYVRRSLEKLGEDLPVLILVRPRPRRAGWATNQPPEPHAARRSPAVPGVRAQANFRDLTDKVEVSKLDGQTLAESFEHRRGGTYFAEASMRDNFGLKYFHRFLNVPFLVHQVRERLGVRQVCGGARSLMWRWGGLGRAAAGASGAGSARCWSGSSRTTSGTWPPSLRSWRLPRARTSKTMHSPSAAAASLDPGARRSSQTRYVMGSPCIRFVRYQDLLSKLAQAKPAAKPATPGAPATEGPAGEAVKAKGAPEPAADKAAADKAAADKAAAEKAAAEKAANAAAKGKKAAAAKAKAAAVAAAAAAPADPNAPISVDNFVPPSDGDLDDFFSQPDPAPESAAKKAESSGRGISGFFKRYEEHNAGGQA